MACIIHSAIKCDRIKANIDRIEMHLNNSLMMATALTPIIGYDKTCA